MDNELPKTLCSVINVLNIHLATILKIGLKNNKYIKKSNYYFICRYHLTCWESLW